MPAKYSHDKATENVCSQSMSCNWKCILSTNKLVVDWMKKSLPAIGK